ncbi:hypothetical protein E2320_022360, partial [Naja naja]
MFIKECEVNEEYIGKGRIGKIYRILTELEEQAKGLKLTWESDLGDINDNDWKNIWNRRVYKNMSVRVKENGCKIALLLLMETQDINETKKELIVNLIMAARLVMAKYWGRNWDIQRNEWNDEIW